MRWLFEQFPVALVIYDRNGRLLRLNAEMARTIDYSEDEVRGLRLPEFLEGPMYDEAYSRLLRIAMTGEPESMEFYVRSPGESRPHAWVADLVPLKDAAGQVHAIAAMVSDYTQQRGSRERMALLSEARTRIGISLDVTGTARELSEVAVPRLADFVAVDLLDAVFRGELPAPVLRGPVTLRRTANRSVHPEAPEAAFTPGEIHLHPSSSPITRCLVSGRAALRSFTDPEVVHWLAEDPLRAAQARASAAHSLIAAPIRARGTTLGAALFIRHAASPEPFTHDDLTLAEDLVSRASICVDNARRYTRERSVALALQRDLLPREPMVHTAVDTAVRYLPAGGGAGVGGDWFDVIPLPGTRIGLVVGDVVGHGVNAAATMGRLRTAVRTLADIDLPPEELLTRLDGIVTHSMCEQSTAIAEEMVATCLYVVYDPIAHTCSLARAGHPAPILVRPDGTARVVDLPAGPPLGLGSLPFEGTELPMADGCLLALFTDGLIEARDRDLDHGIDRLCRALARPAPSLEALCDIVVGTLRSQPHADDIALLVARARALNPDHVASWDLPTDPAVVAEARRQVGKRLTAWGLQDMTFTTELVVSELVTNAIRHAAAPIQLRLIRDQTLICELSDGSDTTPHMRRARLSDEGGRGLLLVAELTERWGTRHTPTGKTIWTEQLIA
jgi:PAS domain S-box-containing protein